MCCFRSLAFNCYFKTLAFHKVVCHDLGELYFIYRTLAHRLFQSLTSVATHFRCGGVFSDSIFLYKFSPDPDSEKCLKVSQYLMKL